MQRQVTEQASLGTTTRKGAAMTKNYPKAHYLMSGGCFLMATYIDAPLDSSEETATLKESTSKAGSRRYLAAAPVNGPCPRNANQTRNTNAIRDSRQSGSQSPALLEGGRTESKCREEEQVRNTTDAPATTPRASLLSARLHSEEGGCSRHSLPTIARNALKYTKATVRPRIQYTETER